MIPYQRMCKRNVKVIFRQALWTLFILQLCALSFVAVSFRREETRQMVKDAVLRPLLLVSPDGGGHAAGGEGTVDQDMIRESSAPRTGGSSTGWKFRDFDVERWNSTQELRLSDQEGPDKFFRKLSSGSHCFVEGTDFAASEAVTVQKEVEEGNDGEHGQTAQAKCVCVQGYFGPDCGIPGAVWYSHFAKHPRERKKLRARSSPRRLIHAVLVNHEFDFFETRVNELEDVVDAFIVQESNFTTFGNSKELNFLNRFKDGWLKEHQEKMIYVLLPYFRERGKENGWYADAYIRMYLSKQGLPKIKGIRDDDLFLLLDADELPAREVLLFLKLYDGYTEPIRFGFRWTVFGFFWLKETDPSLLSKVPLLGKMAPAPTERLLQLYVACTMGMLRKVYNNNAMLLRRNVYDNDLLKKKVHNYTKVEGHVIREWDAGSLGHYAGHHCSWCYPPEGIRTKLLSAQKHDKPRWGDYPEKTNLTYISRLIATGGWFDDTRPMLPAWQDRNKAFYAPKYIMDNPQRFKYLLDLPKDSSRTP